MTTPSAPPPERQPSTGTAGSLMRWWKPRARLRRCRSDRRPGTRYRRPPTSGTVREADRGSDDRWQIRSGGRRRCPWRALHPQRTTPWTTAAPRADALGMPPQGWQRGAATQRAAKQPQCIATEDLWRAVREKGVMSCSWRRCLWGSASWCPRCVTHPTIFADGNQKPPVAGRFTHLPAGVGYRPNIV